MRLTCRHLGSTELDHELLWLSLSVGSLAGAAVWFWLGLPWPQCLFHKFTGHPCLTCGATRAAIQFFHGHFRAAIRWNPLAFFALCGVTIFDLYAAVVLTFRVPRLRIVELSTLEKNFARFAIILLLGLNWIYLLSRPPGTV